MEATFTITYGDCAENHAGMQKIGQTRDAGLSNDDIRAAAENARQAGYEVELVDLAEYAQEVPEALVMIVRGGAGELIEGNVDELYDEMMAIDHDKRAKMRGRVVNKHARWNVCFDAESQEPNYEAGRGRVVAYEDAPLMDSIRQNLPRWFGEPARNLKAELNYYYDTAKCGIGYHGDTERKVVIGVRVGASLPLHYNWWHQGDPVGRKAEFTIRHGDLYAMSEKAAGSDWRRRVIPTLRHAAGCPKYTNLPNV